MLAYLKALFASNVNAILPDGSTMLHQAVFNKDIKTAALLIKKGADVNLPDSAGMTPAHRMAESGDEEIFKKLMEWGADPIVKNKEGLSLLHLAAKGGSTAICRILKESKVDLNEKTEPNGRSPLHLAIDSKQQEAAEWLIRNGADVKAADAKGWTPLHVAAMNEMKEIIDLLIESGADPDAKETVYGRTVIQMASGEGRKDIAAYLKAKAGQE